MSQLRIVFMGTPDLARSSLQALLADPEMKIIAAVTQPDRPKGRDLKLQPSPVKQLALSRHIPVLQPARARQQDFLAQMKALAPDLIAVAAFGQILPQSLLDLPRFGCLNVHTSLLPRYRGAAPIQWAILNGDHESGVTIMKMDAGLDTGDILTQEKTPIAPEDSAITLHDRLAEIGARLLVRTIHDYAAGKILPQPQPSENVVHAPKIKKEHGHIAWSKPARAILNQVRGLVPWPGAFTFLPPHDPTGAATLLKIWDAQLADANGQPGEITRADKTGILVCCGEKALNLTSVQREGGRRLPARDFLTGHPLQPGQRLQ